MDFFDVLLLFITHCCCGSVLAAYAWKSELQLRTRVVLCSAMLVLGIIAFVAICASLLILFWWEILSSREDDDMYSWGFEEMP